MWFITLPFLSKLDRWRWPSALGAGFAWSLAGPRIGLSRNRQERAGRRWEVRELSFDADDVEKFEVSRAVVVRGYGVAVFLATPTGGN